MIENETTYLAFPPVHEAVIIAGGGYALSQLEPLTWLSDLELVYWGDIDTHGFAILDRLRQKFPHARSMLMDSATLLAHPNQWVTEATPVNAPLEMLRPDEAALYHDLVEDTYGTTVRLEQERISYAGGRTGDRHTRCRRTTTGMTDVLGRWPARPGKPGSRDRHRPQQLT